MSQKQAENPAISRPLRPRANTSLWRRNRPDSSTSTPLSSTPAAPLQTLPLETLIQDLTPPAVPSLNNARSLITALSTQTPAPSPSTLTPILAGLCDTNAPPSLQAVGFDVLSAYCMCGVILPTSDRLTYFDLLQAASRGAWSADVWEPRLKALVALMPSADDTMGVEKALLEMISGWLDQAVDALFSTTSMTIVEKHERERAVEALSEALTHWSEKLESSGRLSDADILSLFEFYQKLVDHASALKLPLDAMQSASTPPTPFRENSSSSVGSPARHRRHPSSTSNLSSPLGTTPLVQQRSSRNPVHLVMTIYLSFLGSRITRLPPSYLPTLLPLLFRILATLVSPLPTISPRPPSMTERSSIEHRIVKVISSLLTGPYSTTSLILLKRHLLPSSPSSDNAEATSYETQATTSLGALRTLRVQIRHVLEDRMAMRYVQRDSSMSATHAGTPSSGLFLDQQLIDRAERAWRKEGAAVWDARKVSFLLVKSIKAWIALPFPGKSSTEKERLFEEVAGLLKDVLLELEDKELDQNSVDKDEDNDTARSIGETLYELMNYVRSLRNEDGSPVIISPSNALSAQTPLLRILADILCRGRSTRRLEPPLPIILLAVADHLVDADSEKIPSMMAQQHELNPTSSEWLKNWSLLLSSQSLFAPSRPLTRQAVLAALQAVFMLTLDMPSYRRRLSDAIFDFWMRLVEERNEGGDGAAVWKLLGDEIMLRSVEDDIEELFTPTDEYGPANAKALTIHKVMATMMSVSGYCDCGDEDDVNLKPVDHSVSPLSPLPPVTPSNTLASGAGSPVLPRTGIDLFGAARDRDASNVPQQLMSLLTFGGSRHQVPQVSNQEEPSSLNIPRAEPSQSPLVASPDPTQTICRGATAIVALIDVFTQLAFANGQMTERQASLAIYVFSQLLTILRTAHCSKVRLYILQMLMRLRADRDHRVFLKRDPAEHEKQILRLARLVDRLPEVLGSVSQQADDTRFEEAPFERARPRQPFERDGRRASRGRGNRASDTVSRSRSRATGRARHQMTMSTVKPRGPIWMIPDSVPFSVENTGKASRLLITYDSLVFDSKVVLSVSDYMDVLVEILKTERDWEILSYVLVHLPAQLANKHFWCGPMSKVSLSTLLTELCKGISDGTLGRYVPLEEWPGALRPRDAQGLAFHTLTVLVSYQNVFDVQKRHALIEVFQAGLSGKGDTVVICLHAMSLCVFEMESSMTKALPRILEKLSQIMSNPSMAVHILTFLGIVATLPHLYSNFTENDFKMVFGVALQYLQHHNRPENLLEIQFSLSQHVRILSYYIVYVWFLALKLSERPQHVKFIARQLLLANEGRENVDESTEVCFDWLARYTYATADPKPAPSLLADILSDPVEGVSTSDVQQEKSWVLGYSIVTVRLLAKPGWMEVVTRRASGTTKFLCRSENVPLVDLGDLNPDMVTIPAALMMDKDLRSLGAISTPAVLSAPPEISPHLNGIIPELFSPSEASEVDPECPDPITGYVWTGSAPSQRRKSVDLDPSFFPLQLSSYPDIRHRSHRGKIVRDTRALASTIRTLDRLPVIDTHKVGILYVAPGQTEEMEILQNSHGSPAYTRFLEGIGRLIKIGGQLDVYTGGLDPDEDGDYAYAWWDDTGQILYHTATLMPSHPHDERCNYKKRHIGNDLVRIVWNDSGLPYRFDTLSTEFQFVNIIIEPHSDGAIAAYSNSLHENEYFKLSIQRAEGMAEFTPIVDFKIVSARSLPPFVRQISLVADWYASIFKDTVRDTERNEIVTNWRARLDAIKKFANAVPSPFDSAAAQEQGIMGQEVHRDFTPAF